MFREEHTDLEKKTTGAIPNKPPFPPRMPGVSMEHGSRIGILDYLRSQEVRAMLWSYNVKVQQKEMLSQESGPDFQSWL